MNKRVKTPLLLQLESVECGAASLGIMLEYFGRIVPLTQLRVDCGVSRDGVKASNIVKAARKYHLKCKGFKESLQSALERPFPYVVFWNFNHFLVVEGFDDEKKIVYLNDPAHGHRKVTMDEFDESFTGVVLLFEEDDEFEKGGGKPSTLDAIRERFKHAHSAVKYLVCMGLLLTIPGLVIPAYTRIYLDEVMGELREDWLRPIITVLLVTVLFKLVVEFFKFLYLRRLKIHLAVSMSSRFVWHLMRLPMFFYAQRYSGEIANRQALNDNMADILSGRLADTALQVMMMVFYAILMFYYNATLTLIGMAFAALSFIGLRLLSRARVDANMRLRQDFGKVAGDTIAALQSMETIKASGQESAFFHKWGGRYAKAANSLQELEISTQSLTILPTVFNALNTATIYLIGANAVIEGTMSIGTLVAFTALMTNFQEPIKDLVDLGSEIQELDGDLKRLDDVLMADVDPESVGADTPDSDRMETGIFYDMGKLQLRGDIKVKDLTFGYSPLEEPLFDRVNIDIPAGQPGRIRRCERLR